MDLFTPSPKPRKRPAPVADIGRRTKTKTPQSTRSESLASNSRPRASREPTDSTRRKPQNAKAGPSKLGKQSSAASTPPTRQSTRVSRPTLKKAAAADIVLSSDEDSDLPSPSTIFKRVPKTPPKPKKRKRPSSPFTTQKKISKVIYLEISDSDDDEQAKARPTKRPKVMTNTAAPEDVINLCSSSEVGEEPPSSPLAQAKKRKISPEMDTQNAETADTEVRMSKKPSRERGVPTPKVADTQPEVDPPHPVSHSPAPLSPAPPIVFSPTPQRLVPLPTRIGSIPLVRTKSMLSGRKFTRPERDSEITYFEPDAQPQLTLLTPTFFKKSIASVKAKIEVQKRQKKKAAATTAFASTSAPVTAARLDAQVAPETMAPVPVANAPLPEPSDLPPQLDDTLTVFVEQTAPEPAPLPEPIESMIIPTMSEETQETEATTENSLSEPIEPILTTNNEISEPDAALTLREIPEFNDLVASAKHVTTVLDRLKALRRRGDSSSPYKSLQPLQVNTQPASSAVDEAKTAAPSSPPGPAESAQCFDHVLTPRRSTSIPIAGGDQDPPKPATDAQIEVPLGLQPTSPAPTSSKSPLPPSIVPADLDDSNNSRQPSTSAEVSGPPDSPTTATTTSDVVTDADALQRPLSPSAPYTGADAVVSSTTKRDSVFPILDLDLALLSRLPEFEGDDADYDDLSLSDLELVYPEDLV